MAQHSLIHFSKTLAYSPFSHPAPRTALLLLDYQNLIVGMLPNDRSESTTSTAAQLREWAIAHKILTVHCLVRVREDEPLEPQRKINELWPALSEVIKQNPSVMDEIPQLKASEPPRATRSDGSEAEEITVSRRVGRFSTLTSDGIQDVLRGRGITSLVIGGISTSACVLSTAREAADEGYVVTVVQDACADRSDEIHETVLNHVLPSSANVVDLATWTKEWDALSG